MTVFNFNTSKLIFLNDPVIYVLRFDMFPVLRYIISDKITIVLSFHYKKISLYVVT